jgi:hypothetical protein
MILISASFHKIIPKINKSKMGKVIKILKKIFKQKIRRIIIR